jgi:hypothetical protein
MRKLSFLPPVILLSMCVSALHATTIHVPADSATIQAGINGAVDGDTVLVADGVYTGEGNRGIDFLGKAIVVTSEGGPDVTIIDCEGSGIAFYFLSEESSSSVLDGFTIQNGHSGGLGGAVDCQFASPTISNNIFATNSTSSVGFPSMGGAIWCVHSDAVISNNTFTGNHAHSDYSSGGAIYCGEGSPTIINNTFSANYVDGEDSRGGAIYGGSAIISHNTFSDNYCFNDTPFSDVNGGAIYGGATISDNIFIGNYVWMMGSGGAIYCSNATVSQNTFTANQAGVYGSGGAIYGSSPTVKNCILWGDSPDEIGGSPTVTYCDVEGGWEGEGNIDAEPLFVDPENRDYHLQLNSPCINAGDPEYVPNPGETDVDGELRIMRGRVDMGVDEVPYPHHRELVPAK